MAPAPNPKGIAQRINSQKLPLKENPSRATAVSAVLNADTRAVPNRRITWLLIRLETTVPQDVVTVTKLAKEMGRENSL